MSNKFEENVDSLVKLKSYDFYKTVCITKDPKDQSKKSRSFLKLSQAHPKVVSHSDTFDKRSFL